MTATRIFDANSNILSAMCELGAKLEGNVCEINSKVNNNICDLNSKVDKSICELSLKMNVLFSNKDRNRRVQFNNDPPTVMPMKLFGCTGCRAPDHYRKNCFFENEHCTICETPGHLWKNCPWITCYGCGQSSHRQIECPQGNATFHQTNSFVTPHPLCFRCSRTSSKDWSPHLNQLWLPVSLCC